MAAIDRVLARILPWASPAQDDQHDELVNIRRAFASNHPNIATPMLSKAYEIASRAHEDQWRRSGDPYISHPLGVAEILAGLGLDETTLVAALLHDAVEDTDVTLEDVRESFGDDVAHIVNGVTKLDSLNFPTRQDAQAETLRKMVVAMTDDIRVLFVKLADRLHNAQTLGVMSLDKQQRIAHETLTIYAPLAHRLGLGSVKRQLEELSFAALEPRRYAELDMLVESRAPQRELEIQELIAEIEALLSGADVKAKVSGRPKQLWSVYEKMVQRGRELDDITDLIGLRVIVSEVRECWQALGIIHGAYLSIPGRFKDYIGHAKFNLYQSIHTTVISRSGRTFEVQIRTEEMHEIAEFGAAAHWSYKQRPSGQDSAWMERLSDWQAFAAQPQEFMEGLQGDLGADEIYIFTPKGKVVSLPVGAKPLDFAYAVHTEVGHRCIGAKVNGRLVSLDTDLNSGDTVDIVTSRAQSAGPSRDWLDMTVTPRARTKIRQWFNRERREDALEMGSEDLDKELKRLSLGSHSSASVASLLEKVATSLHYLDVESLLVAIGEGHVSARSTAQRVAKSDEVQAVAPPIASVPRRKVGSQRPEGGIIVAGMTDMLVRLAGCCQPVPGDAIVGFITQGRGVSVHLLSCDNVESLMRDQPERIVDVSWDKHVSGVFSVSIEVKSIDREGLLADVTRSLSDHRVNVTACATLTSSDRVARLRFDFGLADPAHLELVLAAVLRVESVYDCYRIQPGQGTPVRDGRRASLPARSARAGASTARQGVDIG